MQFLVSLFLASNYRRIIHNIRTLSRVGRSIKCDFNIALAERQYHNYNLRRQRGRGSEGVLHRLWNLFIASTSRVNHLTEYDNDIDRDYKHQRECIDEFTKGFRSLQKYREDTDRDVITMVWKLVSFCCGDMLNEYDKFVRDNYKDLFDRYTLAVDRRKALREDINHEKKRNKRLEIERSKLKMDLNALKKKNSAPTPDVVHRNNMKKEEGLQLEVEYLRKENETLKTKLKGNNEKGETNRIKISQLERALKVQTQREESRQRIVTPNKPEGRESLLRSNRFQIQQLKRQLKKRRLSKAKFVKKRDARLKERSLFVEPF